MHGLFQVLIATGVLVCMLGCGGKSSGEESEAFPNSGAPEELPGTWKGHLSVQGTELPLVFHF